MVDQRLEIVAVGRRGEGAATVDGRPVHIPRVLPGEMVRADLSGDSASLVAIETASPERIAPFCKHYGDCGGCQLQHWREGPYRQWKRDLVVTALARRGVSAGVSALIDAHGAGRRRVSLHVRREDKRVTAGFMAARSHSLHDIDRCPILVPALDRSTDIARAIGFRLGDCDVALTATETGIDAAVRAERKIVARQLEKLAPFVSEWGLARLSVNGDVIATARVPLVKMGRALVPLPPGAFLQATQEGETVLARLVVEALGKAKSVADLFCGCGPFALRLAETARVAAVDSDRAAVAALGQAYRAVQGLKPLTATARDLYREPLAPSELKDHDAVVLDPPRAGAEAQARQLAKSGVKTVIMVSCDPASLARDAEILTAGGYAAGAVTPVDQFKWTSHVEMVAVFRR